MNKLTSLRWLPQDRLIHYTQPVRYAEAKQLGKLIVVPGQKCLRTAQSPQWEPSSLPVLAGTDLTVVGFRTYVTADGYFFNDQTQVADFNLAKLEMKLARLPEAMSLKRVGENYEIETTQATRIVEEPVISLLSDEPSNYGSWLYRIVPKLMDWAVLGHMPVFVWRNSGWMIRLIEKFTRSDVRVIGYTPSINYRLREAIIPSQRNYGVRVDVDALEFLRSVVVPRVGSGSERLYLARGQGKRSLLNEGRLQSLLVERGFQVVNPSSMPIDNQIELMANARCVVCPGGAGLYNLLFAKNCELVIDLEPGPEWVSAHHNLLSSSGIDHVMLFGERSNPEDAHSPWVLPETALTDTLDFLSL